MKRILLTAILALFVAGAPALACSGDKAAKTQVADALQSEITNLEDGVRVKLTSSDAAMVKAMQKEARTFLASACASSCPMKAKGSSHEVKNLDNGVVIEAKAGCPSKVKEIQQYAKSKIANGEFMKKAKKAAS
jgi:TusA-related sulfurtransferase